MQRNRCRAEETGKLKTGTSGGTDPGGGGKRGIEARE